MKAWFATIGPLDALVVGLGLVVLGSIGVPGPIMSPAAPAQAIVELSPDSVLEGHGVRVLDGKARASFQEKFVGSDYFAAFAYAPDGGYGWSTGNNSPQAARQNAMARCERWSRGCEIVAEIQPRDYNAQPGRTLRQREVENFKRYSGFRGAKAFAISENGAYGMNWNNISIHGARRRAIANCEAAKRKNQPGFMPDWPCFVIDSSW